MSLEYAILGFLNYKPMTGYDLKKMFDDSVRHFWYADQSQIYRTLNRLNEKGWVSRDIIEQDTRPDRKEYSITDSGREALRQWLVSQPNEGAPHSSPLIQVFFAGQFPDEVVVKMFEFADQIMDRMLATYGEIPEKIEEYREMLQSDREMYFWNATLELGVRIAKTQQEWARDLISDLKNGRVPQK
jgi:DNA-binding PadR family transcriptional regulator